MSTTKLLCRSCALVRGPVADDDAQDPAICGEEGERGEPEPREEGALPQELELVALLEPGALGADPEQKGRDAEPGVAEEGGAGEVERQEHHVPEEVLFTRREHLEFKDSGSRKSDDCLPGRCRPC